MEASARANPTAVDAPAGEGPLFSVIVPVYNGGDMLRKCLDAICNQTIPIDRYEVIVIDDCSTDETPEIAAEFPVRLIRLEQNSGRLVARETGAREARSDLLMFCDVRVLLEKDVFATALAAGKSPLMYGSDHPDEQQASLMGRFFFCVYRRLWKPYYPQEWWGEELEITPDNFDAVPKGTTFFVVAKDFWLRHQPAERGKHTNDDTLIFSSMVREKPIIRYSPMKCHYQQRTDLASSIPHLHHRGVRFSSFYIRPGHRYFLYYLCMWALLLAGVVAAAIRPSLAWVIPAGLAGAWLGLAAWWATSPRNLLAMLICLPIVATAFGTGILRSHWIALRGAWRGMGDGATTSWRRRALSWGVLAGILAVTGWYVHSNWDYFFHSLPAIRVSQWATLAGLLLLVHLFSGMIINRMAEALGVRLRTDQWLGLSFMTAFGNMFGPARAGLIMRSVYLKRHGMPYSLFVSSLGGTYILSLLAQMSVAAAGLAMLYFQGQPVPLPVALLVGAALAGGAVLAIWAPAPAQWVRRKLPPVARVLEGWRTIIANRRIVRQTLIFCTLGVLNQVAILWYLYRILGEPVSVGTVAVMSSIGGLVALIAVTPGAVGFFELGAIGTGKLLGVPVATGVAAMVALRAADVALNLSLGPWWIWYLMQGKAAAPAEDSEEYEH